jgi:F-type H+-transporting ATPase subunit a
MFNYNVSDSSYNTSNNYLFEITTPLDQFEIRDYIIIDAPILGNAHLSLNNMGLYIIIAFFIIVINFGIINKLPKFINRSWVLTKECIYDTIHSVVTDQINKNNGQIYFPFIFTLFLFILVNNLIGLIPYSFSATSHFLLAFSWSFAIVLGTVVLGTSIHNIKFLGLFVPQGCPLALAPFLTIIEAISFVARNVSLGLRLAANMLAGHMLLVILSGFTFNIFKAGLIGILGFLPLLFIIAFSFLEFAIAFIQAQVFIVLTSGYIKDGLDLH